MFRPIAVVLALALVSGTGVHANPVSNLRGRPTSDDEDPRNIALVFGGGGGGGSLKGDDSPLLKALRTKAMAQAAQGHAEEKARSPIGKDAALTVADSTGLSKADVDGQEFEEKGAGDEKEREKDHKSFARRWVQDHDARSPAEFQKARERRAHAKAARVASQAAANSAKASQSVQPAVQPAVQPVAAGTCGGEEPGCHSMCRWLQLKVGGGNAAKCPLFDNQLKACGYVMPEDRPTPVANPLDCAVELTRAYVRENEVPDYVVRFESCMNGVPAKLNATCSGAVGLLHSEMNDWRADKFNENDAEVLRKELEEACDQGQKALDAQTGEQEAIDRLSSDLSKAEKIPGHYLVAEEHKARGLLDRLGPIPAVREQLRGAVIDARRAFKSTSLFHVKEDIVWLRVAVTKAEDFELGPQTADARDLLTKLQGLEAALASVKHSVFQATVSLTTKSGVPEAVMNLRESIAKAKAAGLKHELKVEKDLLAQLEQLETAVVLNLNATSTGEALLRGQQGKGLNRLRVVAKQLNDTVRHAQNLGLADNATTEAALATLDKVNYVSQARAALHAVVEASSALVPKTVSVLSDDADEAAIDRLDRVILWANEVGLDKTLEHNVKGVPMAQKLKKRLKVIEGAKEGMSVALAQARSSWEAKCCAEHAIQLLKAAVKDCGEKGVTAGAEEAQTELERMHLLQNARAALGIARNEADATYSTRRGFQNSTGSMEFAIDLAQRAGIADKAKIAIDQLKKLRAFADADHELVQALSEPIPVGPASYLSKIEDPEPKLAFNRSGLKPEHFAHVVLADDDGDADFDEHIEAMETALEDASLQGTVDSDLKAQLEIMRRLRAAYAGVEAASEVGEKALKYKHGIGAAVMQLAAAVREGQETGLTLGVREAGALLEKLTVIQPARDELRAATLQANASMHWRADMDPSLLRLNEAIDVNAALGLTANLPKANHLRDQVLYLKKTWVDLSAAITQGELALDGGSGEEAAIAELHRCIDQTDEVNLHSKVHKAVDVLHWLTRQNAAKQQAQAATRLLWNQDVHRNL